MIVWPCNAFYSKLRTMTQSAVDIVDILAGLTLFADLTHPQLESVSHIFDEEMFDEGQRILRRGFSGSGFYVIIEGEAKVSVDEEYIQVLGRGEFFGEISILLGEPPSADITASSPLRCLVISSSELRPFLETYPRVMFRMLQAMAMKLRKTLR